MAEAGAEVAVDFTVLGAARANARWCADHGVHAVIGTTGFAADDLDELRRRSQSNCLVAPNFAIGAVLMMRFAELAAPYFETAEVIELHHDAKIDAPSGTAMMTVQRMAAASPTWAPDPTDARGRGRRPRAARARRHPGALGAPARAGRPPGGAARHGRADAHDPPRLLRPHLVHAGGAAGGEAVASRPGLTVGLDALLGL